jgi:DNA-binding NtrC family response regulator
VDDDAGFAGMLAKIVREEGGEAVLSHNLAAAREQIARRPFDVVILDNGLPDGTGFEFYPQLARRHPTSIVVMITGAPELSQAVELTRNGLFDYLTKPLSADGFSALLRRVKLRLRPPSAEMVSETLLGNSPVMTDTVGQLRVAARHSDATVLLAGETGTGKEVAARLVHRLTFGERAADLPFVALNCPNVPADMFEAELFGSERGAYTGADRRRAGLAEAAEGGTLFLDEIGEIPVALQPKLLRFLESREYRALGATGVCRFDGRIIAATNRNLPEEVRAGRFREDLMYRLDVFSVRLPALREHPSDVDQIAEGLLAQLCEKYRRTRPSLKTADLAALKGYSFPGNVRELRNLLERSLLRSNDTAAELTMDLAWLKGRDNPPSSAAQLPQSASFTQSNRQLSALEQQEYDLIAKTLVLENGGIRRAATKLGLTHQALLRRLQKWPELRQIPVSPG